MTAIFKLLCNTGVAPITAKWLTCNIIAFPSILLIMIFFMKRNQVLRYVAGKIKDGSKEYDEDFLDFANNVCHAKCYLVCMAVLIISMF